MAVGLTISEPADSAALFAPSATTASPGTAVGSVVTFSQPLTAALKVHCSCNHSLCLEPDVQQAACRGRPGQHAHAAKDHRWLPHLCNVKGQLLLDFFWEDCLFPVTVLAGRSYHQQVQVHMQARARQLMQSVAGALLTVLRGLALQKVCPGSWLKPQILTRS